MQHYFPFKSLLIILTACFFLSSCSTSYQASRFSHLKYVKKDHVSTSNDAQAFKKEDIQGLKGHEAPATLEVPDNDYAASLEKTPSSKIKKQHSYTSNNSRIFQSPVPEQYSQNKKNQSSAGKVAPSKSFLKDNSINFSKKSSPGSLMYDQQKLLILWIALFSAALVFGIVGYYVPFIWIFATLAFVAGLVFFIFWLVAIANE